MSPAPKITIKSAPVSSTVEMKFFSEISRLFGLSILSNNACDVIPGIEVLERDKYPLKQLDQIDSKF